MKFSTIAVHNSDFHADDLFAVATLLEVAKKRGDPEPVVSRLRKPEDLEKQDIVADIGGIYDPERGRFDHHQSGYNERRPSVDGQLGFQYAAFGLIWKHFGKELCSVEIHQRVDRNFIQAIDAHDVGEDITCEYRNCIAPLFLRDALYRHRPLWNEVTSNDDFDKGFFAALPEARSMLKWAIKKEESQIEANKVVQEAYKSSSNKQIIELPKNLPFIEQMVEYSEPLFVVFQNIAGFWHAQAVPVKQGSFEIRKKFPESWAGARYPNLEKITGVEGARNAHLARFLVTASTKEAAYKLIELALK